MPSRDEAWARYQMTGKVDPPRPKMDRNRPVHWSELKHMARSPAHYVAAVRYHPKPTPAMQFGTLVHALVLGGEYLTWPGDRRGKAWEEFRDANTTANIFTASEVERGEAVAREIVRHPEARKIIRASRCEVSVSWTFLGHPCETRGIDLLGPDDLSELKTCGDARPERFGWHAKSMGYLGQLAWYEPAAIALGVTPKSFRIIAAEVRPPYDVVVHRITDEAMDYARRAVRALMERLLVCEENDSWPGYSDAEVSLDVDREQEFVFAGDEEAA